MQIKYTTNHHQTKAINSITELFYTQNKNTNEYDIFDGDAVVANKLSIDKRS